MSRRLTVTVAALAICAVPAWASGSTASWALPQIRVVVAHGLMAPSVKTFRPNDSLTRGDLTTLSAALSERAAAAPADPSAPATMSMLDAGLVRSLGLGDSAYRFYLAFRAAGLKPPSRFGNEVVARLLQLRANHPAGHD